MNFSKIFDDLYMVVKSKLDRDRVGRSLKSFDHGVEWWQI